MDTETVPETQPFNRRHPELRPGERWLGNYPISQFPYLPHRTKRRGQVAYDPDGVPLTESHGASLSRFVPVFVSADEPEKPPRMRRRPSVIGGVV